MDLEDLPSYDSSLGFWLKKVSSVDSHAHCFLIPKCFLVASCASQNAQLLLAESTLKAVLFCVKLLNVLWILAFYKRKSVQICKISYRSKSVSIIGGSVTYYTAIL